METWMPAHGVKYHPFGGSPTWIIWTNPENSDKPDNMPVPTVQCTRVGVLVTGKPATWSCMPTAQRLTPTCARSYKHWTASRQNIPRVLDSALCKILWLRENVPPAPAPTLTGRPAGARRWGSPREPNLVEDKLRMRPETVASRATP